MSQLVANRARTRKLTREDGATACAMDRLLYRLGRSAYASELFLKGGIVVANLVAAPHRFTRDIDLARRHGRCEADELRQWFREIAAVSVDDGVRFDPDGVRAVIATHDVDGYDGIKVRIRGAIGAHPVDVQVDVGFGDAVWPPAERISLQPYLDSFQPARVLAYGPEPVVAEKVETLLSKFPAIGHRLKDLLDVVMLAGELSFEGTSLLASLRTTFERRGARVDGRVLDEMATELVTRKWLTDWATMRRDKRVLPTLELSDAIRRFDALVRPLLGALADRVPPPRRWLPGGPWSDDVE